MRLRALATAAAIALTALPAYAHFGVLMPGSELVNRPKTPLELTLAFCHPVEQNGMNLAKPEAFDVWQNGKKTSLLRTNLYQSKLCRSLFRQKLSTRTY